MRFPVGHLQFLLTRPLRDVTILHHSFTLFHLFLLTRPLRDVTSTSIRGLSASTISTHTPLAGRDYKPGNMAEFMYGFLLTRPLRDVTYIQGRKQKQVAISTHTPLAGRDLFLMWLLYATYISTHTPLAGRDIGQFFLALTNIDFYSHAPCGT